MKTAEQIHVLDVERRYNPNIADIDTCWNCDETIIADEVWGWLHYGGKHTRRLPGRNTLLCRSAAPTPPVCSGDEIPASHGDMS